MGQVYALRSLTGNTLTVASDAAFAMGGTWTIEFWYRQVNAGSGSGRVLSNAFATANYHELYFDVPGQIRLASQVGFTVLSTGFANNTNAGWTHYAFVCNGSTTSTYRNGVLFDSNNASPSPYGNFNAISAFQFFVGTNSYFRFFRISNNVRYTGNFTPPNDPFSNDGNTVLLVNANTPSFSELSGKIITTNTTSQVIVDDTNLPAETNPYPTTISVEALVVAGGGGAGGYGGFGNGGGGAGGFLYNPALSINLGQSYPVTVGLGGAKGVHSANSSGVNGTNSSFAGLTAIGGGFGAGLGTSGQAYSGGAGGSGGGASGQTTIPRSGGAGTVGQGFNGAGNLTGSPYYGGGGAGAGSAASTPNGGSGVLNSISGSPVLYAVGGTAGSASGDPGSNNTAPGSGGNGGWPGVNGQVIIKYLSSAVNDGTGGTITHSGGYTIHTFNTSGTFIAPTFIAKSIKLTSGKIVRSTSTQNIIRNSV